ncbi:VID27 cytoplasmic protein-domain-containing protein [Lentinula raphanica]|uniref:VID27 cytoplasmic protein-domain-containing protein n=1 Tax=Lentinula raphanica TaxID=153919 RepID=A0AA38PLZ4_9AGAR|nr:VID27 cytoplasmic protein-domain-containing protein [Lentinula raphanica]KAJ3845141.1 VID27 cytoplasmic protein-domain-containing protein [Lentinula raphanica]
MNIFRSLIGKVWQDPNAAEVVKISTGQLYILRPGNIRTDRECIFNEAMATIRRVPNMEHNFQLVITRVYEEGDQELLEDEEETDEERVYLISQELEFRTDKTNEGEPNFVWRDLAGDVDEFYEFVATGINEPTKAFFETCMYRAMYERKYMRTADSINEPDLEEFVYKPSTRKRPPPRRKVTRAPSTSSVEEVKPPPPTNTTSPKGKEKASVVKQFPGTPVYEIEEVELYHWEGEEGFVNQGIFSAHIVKTGQFDYSLCASTDDAGILLDHKFTSSMNPKFNPRMRSVTWNHVKEGQDVSSWLFAFHSEEEYRRFCEKYMECGWETLNQMPFNKIKEEDKRYVMSSTNEDVEMLDIEDEEEDEEEVLSELDPDEESESEEEDDYDEEEDPQRLTGDSNSQLTVGYRGDNAFVVRGNNIGVFRHNPDAGSMIYASSLSRIQTPKEKQAFKPENVMLHDQDTKMIMMNPANPHSLYQADLEYGKVVEEWKVHDDIAVSHIAPTDKFAPTTHEQTLVGTSHNALFRIDPRVSGTKMVDSQYKQYAGKNKFSGVATTASGKLAVASEKGDIRLFDSIGKNAKTALPPLGDPIIGIDATADGRWIVATTKTYLLLIDTLIGEGKYQGSLGFDRSFPATAKPIPRRLRLRNEHAAYMNHEISFTPARFNTGEGQEENAIVTSTGVFVIAWDFAKVKKGLLDRYEIKKYEDTVVQDNFRFGDDKQIIVALKNNVLQVNKKALKKPTRQSLGVGASRSSIVNAPF